MSLNLSNRNCDFCNKEYKPRSLKSKCCSRLCTTKHWRIHNKERVIELQKISDLKKTYKLELVTYNQMIKDQDNKCLICKENLTSPFIDHCHKTGIIRGLLCRHCNSLLGYAKDNITTLYSAIEYLKNNTNDQ